MASNGTSFTQRLAEVGASAGDVVYAVELNRSDQRSLRRQRCLIE